MRVDRAAQQWFNRTRHLVRDGIGVSILPRYSLLSPELDHRPTIDPMLSRKAEFAVTVEARLTPALRLLIDQTTSHDWPVIGQFSI